MALVAGVDSSTQSCKVVIRDAATGALVRIVAPSDSAERRRASATAPIPPRG